MMLMLVMQEPPPDYADPGGPGQHRVSAAGGDVGVGAGGGGEEWGAGVHHHVPVGTQADDPLRRAQDTTGETHINPGQHLLDTDIAWKQGYRQ